MQDPSDIDTCASKTILIIEDDADISELLLQALQDETPYQVLLATEGFQALEMVSGIVPHLILIDYLLPNMDGLECIRHLRATKGTEETPIILMSAFFPKHAAERKDILLLEKPFELGTFLQQVKHLLHG
jgi:CheY-like chemotaxis protein